MWKTDCVVLNYFNDPNKRVTVQNFNSKLKKKFVKTITVDINDINWDISAKLLSIYVKQGKRIDIEKALRAFWASFVIPTQSSCHQHEKANSKADPALNEGK